MQLYATRSLFFSSPPVLSVFWHRQKTDDEKKQFVSKNEVCQRTEAPHGLRPEQSQQNTARGNQS